MCVCVCVCVCVCMHVCVRVCGVQTYILSNYIHIYHIVLNFQGAQFSQLATFEMFVEINFVGLSFHCYVHTYLPSGVQIACSSTHPRKM